MRVARFSLVRKGSEVKTAVSCTRVFVRVLGLSCSLGIINRVRRTENYSGKIPVEAYAQNPPRSVAYDG